MRVNASKTHVLWLGSRYNIDKVTVHDVQVLTSTISDVSSARNLGFVMDSLLTTADYVASISRLAYCHMGQIRPIIRSLSGYSANMLVQAFIVYRLD